MTPVYDKNAPKRAVNVSINADLAAKAVTAGINLSEALGARLAELLAETAAAIRVYNERIESGSILSDFERAF
jgi:antitoxin CcdA